MRSALNDFAVFHAIDLIRIPHLGQSVRHDNLRVKQFVQIVDNFPFGKEIKRGCAFIA